MTSPFPHPPPYFLLFLLLFLLLVLLLAQFTLICPETQFKFSPLRVSVESSHLESLVDKE